MLDIFKFGGSNADCQWVCCWLYLTAIRHVLKQKKKSGDRHHCFGLSPDAVCIKSRGGDLSVRLFFDKFHHLVTGSLYAVNVLSARLSEMWLSATAALD